MLTAFRSNRWPYRVARVLLMVALGWWAMKNLVHAQLPAQWAWPNTDFSRTSVDFSEIQSGGLPKDGIPPIDSPTFVSISQASEWIDPREPVIVVRAGGRQKAYPLQIMTWHEIVNDEVGGIPLSVTFCPLCNASIVFDRRLDATVYDFGTTGRLRKSDLIMYDRQTESWWQQFSGEAIVGELTGKVLRRVPAEIVAFEDFARAYPGAPVLSRETGHVRSYGANPYRGYDTVDSQPFLFFDPIDERLAPMERVLNVSVGSSHTVYPFTSLARVSVVNDVVEGVPVVVFSRKGTLSVLDSARIADSRQVPSATAFDRRLDGKTLEFHEAHGTLRDRATGSRWNLFGTAVEGPLAGAQLDTVASGVHFAFAWLAFNPNSRIYPD